MKTLSAIRVIKEKLGKEPVVVNETKFGKRLAVEHNGNFLSFFETQNGDAENFEVSKDLNMNGIFPDNLNNALTLIVKTYYGNCRAD